MERQEDYIRHPAQRNHIRPEETVALILAAFPDSRKIGRIFRNPRHLNARLPGTPEHTRKVVPFVPISHKDVQQDNLVPVFPQCVRDICACHE